MSSNLGCLGATESVESVRRCAILCRIASNKRSSYIFLTLPVSQRHGHQREAISLSPCGRSDEPMPTPPLLPGRPEYLSQCAWHAQPVGASRAKLAQRDVRVLAPHCSRD